MNTVNEAKLIYYTAADAEEKLRMNELLSFFNYKISNFESLLELSEEARRNRPDLIIIDEDLNENEMQLENVQALSKRGIFLLSVIDYSEEKLQLLTEKNIVLLKKPVQLNEIIQRIDDTFA